MHDCTSERICGLTKSLTPANPVTGAKYECWSSCEYERGGDGSCKPEGLLFEPKTKEQIELNRKTLSKKDIVHIVLLILGLILVATLMIYAHS